MPTSSLSPHFFALLAVSLLTALVARYTFPDTLSMEPSTTTFLDALRARRSYYALTADPVIPDTRLIEVIQECILHTPSGMNSQTTTVVVLLHEQHHKLWDLTLDTMRAQVRAQAFGPLEKKLLGVRAGYGTVLFFEDETKIDALKKKVPHLAGRFPINAEHANAMAQLVIWTALEMEGFGASLHVCHIIARTPAVCEHQFLTNFE